ncbi:MAG: glycosyltransferase [Cyanobacteria bacterium P01_F01_bin.150]
MNILIATIGTRGDVQPYLALAMGLKAAGHDVTICTCPRYRTFVFNYGIGFLPLEEGLLELLETEFGRSIVESLNGVFGVLRSIPKVMEKTGAIYRRMVDDCWAATEALNPDMIIYHPKLFCVPAFAAVRKIPAILAMLCPFHVPTGESPLFGPSLGRFYNRWTYRMVHLLTKLGTRGYLRDWRSRHDQNGLSQHSNPTQISPGHSIPVIHAYSQSVCPRPSDWPDNATVTGYWFLPQETAHGSRWHPSSELLAFLEAGPPPVYFGFGSMAGTDPITVTQMILSAVEKANVRAIISTGWGGIVPFESSPNIYVLEFAPHSWLFPKMAAVVHHGGAGTTAAGLRAGCPTIICPFGVDQPFWGRRVAELGAGIAPIPQKELTDTLLANAILRVTNDQSFCASAKSVADAIAQENGIAQAIKTIEQCGSSAIAVGVPT